MAVVTGGSDGMGKSVAMELARKGASVTVVGRDVGKLEAVYEAMKVSLLLLDALFLSPTYTDGKKI